jgi:hypothetical protein
MRKASLAEFLLSLVAPQEQAASMTGDFPEQADRRGRAWFWYSVVRLVGRGVARRAPGGFRAIPVAFVCFALYQIPALTGAVSIRRGRGCRV